MSYGYPRLRAFSAVAVVVVLLLSLPFASDARGESAEEMTQQAVKLFLKEDYTKAAPLFRKAAEQGHAIAQNDLGWLYEEGKGVRQDYTQAAEWYRKAAEQGYASAQNNLGILYEEGKGVLEDYQKAVEWYRKAAEQGNGIALHHLSFMYFNGYGVKKDILTAYAFLLLSAKEGYEDARDIANEMKKTLTTKQITAGQRIASEWEQRIEVNK